MDNTKGLSVLCWNVNSLRKRFIDMQQYVMANNIDVICLQETLIDDSFNPRFSNYNRFILESKDNIRGLVTYVNKNIPAQLLIANFGNDIESISIRLTLESYALNIINIYVPQDKLEPNEFPDIIYEEPTFLMGTSMLGILCLVR